MAEPTAAVIKIDDSVHGPRPENGWCADPAVGKRNDTMADTTQPLIPSPLAVVIRAGGVFIAGIGLTVAALAMMFRDDGPIAGYPDFHRRRR